MRIVYVRRIESTQRQESPFFGVIYETVECLGGNILAGKSFVNKNYSKYRC